MAIEKTRPYLIQGIFIHFHSIDGTTGSLAADGVDFVDEEDAGGVLPGQVKHVSDSGTRAIKISDDLRPIKISDDLRPRDGNERNVGFFGSSHGQRCLAGSRGTLKLRLQLGRLGGKARIEVQELSTAMG